MAPDGSERWGVVDVNRTGFDGDSDGRKDHCLHQTPCIHRRRFSGPAPAAKDAGRPTTPLCRGRRFRRWTSSRRTQHPDRTTGRSRGSAPPSNMCTVYVPPLTPARRSSLHTHRYGNEDPGYRLSWPEIHEAGAGRPSHPHPALTLRTNHPLDVTRLRRDEWSQHPRPPESRRRRIR